MHILRENNDDNMSEDQKVHRQPNDDGQNEEKNKAVKSGKQGSQSPTDDEQGEEKNLEVERENQGSHKLKHIEHRDFPRFTPLPIEEILRTHAARRNAIFDCVDADEYVFKYYPKSTEEFDRLNSTLKETTPFKKLDNKTLRDVIQQLRPLYVAANETVVEQGGFGDYMYIVDHGLFHGYRKEGGAHKLVSTYDNEGCFGELTLLHNEPRWSTVVAQTDGKLWALDRVGFKKGYISKSSKLQHHLMELMDRVPQLKPLMEEEKWRLVDAFHMVSAKKGEVVFHEGDACDGIYFIVEGTATVIKGTDDGKQVELDKLGQSDYFGELALMQEGPRNATVKAMEDCELAFLNVDAFERLLGPCKDLMIEHASTYEDILMKEEGSKAPS